jgi:hypothetical protein
VLRCCGFAVLMLKNLTAALQHNRTAALRSVSSLGLLGYLGYLGLPWLEAKASYAYVLRFCGVDVKKSNSSTAAPQNCNTLFYRLLELFGLIRTED